MALFNLDPTQLLVPLCLAALFATPVLGVLLMMVVRRRRD
jgi:hypothetical protein